MFMLMIQEKKSNRN